MVRQRLSAGRLRCLLPSYYLKNPRRLVYICALFLCATFIICDRQILVRDYREELAKLGKEKEQLVQQLEDLRKFLTGKEEQTFIKLKDDHNDHIKVNMGMSYEDTDPVTRERQSKVKEAMIHAWSSYEKYAWGFDELLPQSRRGTNDFGGLGATIVDSLDTLYIMGLHDQFQKAKDWVSSSLDFNKAYDASVFETTIRVLGGLLSAYDLSGESVFLEKAKDLANRLLPAWDTPTGISYNIVNLAHGSAFNPSWTGGSSVLADIGTVQIEFIGLSQRTGNPIYMQKVENVINQLRKNFPSDGLLPIYISPVSGKPTTSMVTFGAMGDSFYEYLLKVWIQGNKTQAVRHYRDMWEQSMEGLTTLVKQSRPSSFMYIAERAGGNSLIDKMDELACFAPGMLALGSEGSAPDKALKYLNLAKELARTCYQFYQRTSTKLAGENYLFREGQDMVVGTSWNILRPETVESLMYLWRITGDKTYRDWGWDIFQAFETHCRIESGYVGLRDVNTGAKDDKMQTFFLAETLKYLYLLFSPSDVIPLDQWVFNTEAHPTRIIARTEVAHDVEQQSYQKATGTVGSSKNRRFGNVDVMRGSRSEKVRH
eukprot:c26530_g1_i1 orf=613-2406(-)